LHARLYQKLTANPQGFFLTVHLQEKNFGEQARLS